MKINSEDILIARRSLNFEGAAKACLIPLSNETLIFESSMIRITPKRTLILPIYLFYFFNNERAKSTYILKHITKSTISGINQSNLNKVEILVPPISLQTGFVQIVNKTEALKAQYQQSLQELEHLYGSLSQRAFSPAGGFAEAGRGEVETPNKVNLKIAAEPISQYKNKASSTIPSNKRGFAKQVLGGKIVSLYNDDKNVTRIKFQKIQYLAEHIIEEDLLWNYYRQTAGPYDNKFMHNVAFKLKQSKWFEERNYKYYPLEKSGDIEHYFQNYFGTKSERLNNLFNLFKNATEKFSEAVATIYAVWNNHIILCQEFNRQNIKRDFFEWSARKENLFTEDEFEKALHWMQQHNIIPTGFGELIKERK